MRAHRLNVDEMGGRCHRFIPVHLQVLGGILVDLRGYEGTLTALALALYVLGAHATLLSTGAACL